MRILDTGFPGAPLNLEGQEQARALPDRLRDEPIEVVMTSDITRARQTGEPLAKALGVPLITDPGVREVWAGDWDMGYDWSDYVDVLLAWSSDLSRSMLSGEDGWSFLSRFDRAIAELQDYQCVAVVSHGGALRSWLALRTDKKVDDDWLLHNTDVVVVEGQPGAWRMLSWTNRQL